MLDKVVLDKVVEVDNYRELQANSSPLCHGDIHNR